MEILYNDPGEWEYPHKLILPFNQMDEKIAFEYSLYRDGIPNNIKEIDDIDFIINTLVNLSRF